MEWISTCRQPQRSGPLPQQAQQAARQRLEEFVHQLLAPLLAAAEQGGQGGGGGDEGGDDGVERELQEELRRMPDGAEVQPGAAAVQLQLQPLVQAQQAQQAQQGAAAEDDAPLRHEDFAPRPPPLPCKPLPPEIVAQIEAGQGMQAAMDGWRKEEPAGLVPGADETGGGGGGSSGGSRGGGSRGVRGSRGSGGGSCGGTGGRAGDC